jgi:hypothetical protein
VGTARRGQRRDAFGREQRGTDGAERRVFVAEQNLRDLGRLCRAGAGDRELGGHDDEIAHEACRLDGSDRVGVADGEVPEEGPHVDVFADAVDDADDRRVRRGQHLGDARDEPGLATDEARAREGDRVAGSRDHLADGGILVGELRGARENEAFGRDAVHRGDELGGVGLDEELEVDVLVERRHAEGQRGREDHLGLRVEAFAVGHRHLDAAEHAGHRANEIEVPQERRRPELAEGDAVAMDNLLDGCSVAAGDQANPALDERCAGDVAQERQTAHLRLGRRERAELLEVREPLLAHLRHVAGDAAVVTNQAARVGLGGLEVRVVDELAHGLATGRREAALEGLAILLEQEAVFETDVDVIPRQTGGDGQRTEETVAVDAVLLERRVPDVVANVLLPRVEAGAVLERRFEDIGEAAIAAREDTLEHALLRLVHFEIDARALGRAVEQALLALDLGQGVHRAPLKRRVGLGHVRAHADGDAGRAVRDHRAFFGRFAHLAHRAFALVERAFARLDDAADVFVLLGGQADHEVELHAVPALAEDALGRLEQLLLGDVLVDDVAHPLRPCLGREREARGADLAHLVEEIFFEAVGAERRDAERDALGRELRHDLLDERRDTRRIGRRERGQRDLVLAGFFDGLDHGADDLLGIALADGAIDVARLAKAAAFGAATGDLDRHTIEDGLGAADRALRRKRVVFEIDRRARDAGRETGDVGPLHDERARLGLGRDVVEHRHVDAGDLGDGKKALAARETGFLAARPRESDLRASRLAVADDERVEERRDGLGVRRRGAAAEHEGPLFAALARFEAGLCAQRDAAEIEEIEAVGVRELELEREAEHVEIAQRTEILVRNEPEPAGAELFFHVGPGRVGALGERARVVVQDAVEDLEAEVAHPDVVDVREREADLGLELGRRPILATGADFATRVAGGLLDGSEESGVGMRREGHGETVGRHGVGSVTDSPGFCPQTVAIAGLSRPSGARPPWFLVGPTSVCVSTGALRVGAKSSLRTEWARAPS